MSIEGRDVVVSLPILGVEATGGADPMYGGSLRAGVRKAMWVAPFPCALISAQPLALDAPSTASIILDVNLATLSSSAFSSEATLFSSKPTIAASKNVGPVVALTTAYALAKGDVLTVDVDQTGTAPTNETQTLTVDATGGHFTVSFDGETTANILATANAATVQTALLLLPNLNAGDVAVTGGPGDSGGTTPYTLTFGGQYAGTDVPLATAADVDLSGGGTTAAITAGTAGGPGDPGSGVSLVLHLQRI
jgi:hypothetical protein